MARVIVKLGSEEQGIFDLKTEGVTLFGRPHNSEGIEQPDVPLANKEVSRTQCHVVGRNGSFLFFDGWPGNQASANGSKVQAGIGWAKATTDAGAGHSLGEGAVAVVPANTRMTDGFSLSFIDLPIRDEDTVFVGENDLDENTRVVDEGGFDTGGDPLTDTMRVKAELTIASPVRKADVLKLAFDKRMDPNSIAFDGKVFDLSSANRVAIGRGEDAGIYLVEPDDNRARYISRRHAEIEFREEDQAYHLINHSPNGTHVNRQLVTDQVTLGSGDEIGIGSTVGRFKLGAGTRRPPWYVRHRAATRAGLAVAAVAVVVGLALFGYLKLMNQYPERVLSHSLWTSDLQVIGNSKSTAAVADLNGDGILDVVQGSMNGVVWTMDGLRGGQIWNRPLEKTDDDRSIGPVFAPILVADLENDGTPEVIVAAEKLVTVSGATGEVQWYRDGEAGGFVGGAAVADLDGNGVSDIITADGGVALALRGETGGELWRNDEVTLVTTPPAMTDVNRDGVPDAVFSCREDGHVRVLDGRDGSIIWEEPVFGQSKYDGTMKPLSAPAVGDMNGDGVADVVVLTPDYIVYLLDGRSGNELRTFKMKASMFVPTSISERASVTAPVLADMNGDGRLDIVVPHLGNSEGKRNFIYALDGADIEKTLWSYACGDKVAFAPPALADLNGDGVPEVVAALCPINENGELVSGGRIEVIDGLTGTQETELSIPLGAGPNPQIEGTPLLADLDGDRRLDVVVTTSTGAVHTIGLNVPVEASGIAWGSQRNGDAGHGVFRTVPRTTENLLLGVALGALVFGLALGLLSGLFTAMARRWGAKSAPMGSGW